MERKLSTHIEDVVNKIDLKIYETEMPSGDSVFDFEIKEKNFGYYKFCLDENVAAIFFEGLCQIFENDDTDYKRDDEEYSKKVLGDFFNLLKKCDKEYFEQ